VAPHYCPVTREIEDLFDERRWLVPSPGARAAIIEVSADLVARMDGDSATRGRLGGVLTRLHAQHNGLDRLLMVIRGGDRTLGFAGWGLDDGWQRPFLLT